MNNTRVGWYRGIFLFLLDTAPCKDQLSLKEKSGFPASPQHLSQTGPRDTPGGAPAPLLPSSPPVTALPQDAATPAASPKPEPAVGTAVQAGGPGTSQGMASERETPQPLAETQDTQLSAQPLGAGGGPCAPPLEAPRYPSGLGEPTSAREAMAQGEPLQALAPAPSAPSGTPQPTLGQPLPPLPPAVGAISLATPQLPSPPLGPTGAPQPPSALESDGEGPPPRVGFVDSTIKSLDEKLRTLLYQEHVPTSSASAGTPVEAGDRDLTLEPQPVVSSGPTRVASTPGTQTCLSRLWPPHTQAHPHVLQKVAHLGTWGVCVQGRDLVWTAPVRVAWGGAQPSYRGDLQVSARIRLNGSLRFFHQPGKSETAPGLGAALEQAGSSPLTGNEPQVTCQAPSAFKVHPTSLPFIPIASWVGLRHSGSPS